MKKSQTFTYRNIFFIIGLLAMILMVWAIGFDTIIDNVAKTGWWFFVIMGMWLPIYLINTAAFITIIRDENPANHKVSFLHILKINLSGFALKAATPLGFLGGDPYKIMEFRSLFGMEKATSSVLLYTMTHITAHFLFWALSLIAAALFLPMHLNLRIFLLASFFVFVLLLFLIWKGYKKGLTVRFFDVCSRVPYLKKRIVPFCEKHNERLIQIDRQISHLYNARRRAFILTLGLEFFARLCNCIEVYVILRTVSADVTLLHSIVIYAFMSLFTNILFFSPMQIGTREGGFLLAFRMFSLSGGLGIYVSLVTRVRELFWMVIGILLMKVNSSAPKPPVLEDIGENNHNSMF